MPVIESYSFGRMNIDRKTFNKDVIILPDGKIISPWWRKEGHRLASSDLEDLVKTAPEVIVAGTGASGLMRPDAELHQLLSQRSIDFIATPTGEAVEIYNSISGSRKTGACFHLTC